MKIYENQGFPYSARLMSFADCRWAGVAFFSRQYIAFGMKTFDHVRGKGLEVRNSLHQCFFSYNQAYIIQVQCLEIYSCLSSIPDHWNIGSNTKHAMSSSRLKTIFSATLRSFYYEVVSRIRSI